MNHRSNGSPWSQIGHGLMGVDFPLLSKVRKIKLIAYYLTTLATFSISRTAALSGSGSFVIQFSLYITLLGAQVHVWVLYGFRPCESRMTLFQHGWNHKIEMSLFMTHRTFCHMSHGSSVQWVTWVVSYFEWPISSFFRRASCSLQDYNHSI